MSARLRPQLAVREVRSPISYPFDAQLLADERILVAGFTTPGRIVIVNRAGRIPGTPASL